MEHLVGAVAILDAILASGVALNAAEDILAAAGLVEAAMDEMGESAPTCPACPCRRLFLVEGWLP
jgi:hypothetical protein